MFNRTPKSSNSLYQPQPAIAFNNSSPYPAHIKALVSPNGSWTDYYGKPAEIRYSLSLGYHPSIRQYVENHLPNYFDKVEGFFSANDNESLIKTVFKFIEETAQVKFIEDNFFPQIPIYKFEYKKGHVENVPGYGPIYSAAGFFRWPEFTAFSATEKYSSGMGLNKVDNDVSYLSQLFHTGQRERSLLTITHESLHATGLKHGFQPPFAFTKPSELTRTYSALNYNEDIIAGIFGPEYVVPITPLPPEMEALQFIYGINTNTRPGDDTYFLQNYVPSQSLFFSNTKTIACIGYDHGGINTLSAQGCRDDATINMRAYGISEIKSGYIINSKINIHQAISSSEKNTIILNELNNVIDITASKRTSIVVDPLNNGHDTIIGFRPHKDKIIIQREPNDPLAQWGIIQIEKDVKISFDKNNTLTLTNTSKEKLTSGNFATEEKPTLHRDGLLHEPELPSETKRSLKELFYDFPETFIDDFSAAFVSGGLIAFLFNLNEDLLRKYKFTENQIALFNLVIQSSLIICSGSLLSVSAGILITIAFEISGIPHLPAAFLGSLITEICNHLEISARGTITSIARTAGFIAGSKFTLFAYDKVKNFLAANSEEQGYEAISQIELTEIMSSKN